MASVSSFPDTSSRWYIELILLFFTEELIDSGLSVLSLESGETHPAHSTSSDKVSVRDRKRDGGINNCVNGLMEESANG